MADGNHPGKKIWDNHFSKTSVHHPPQPPEGVMKIGRVKSHRHRRSRRRKVRALPDDSALPPENDYHFNTVIARPEALNPPNTTPTPVLTETQQNGIPETSGVIPTENKDEHILQHDISQQKKSQAAIQRGKTLKNISSKIHPEYQKYISDNRLPIKHFVSSPDAMLKKKSTAILGKQENRGGKIEDKIPTAEENKGLQTEAKHDSQKRKSAEILAKVENQGHKTKDIKDATPEKTKEPEKVSFQTHKQDIIQKKTPAVIIVVGTGKNRGVSPEKHKGNMLPTKINRDVIQKKKSAPLIATSNHGNEMNTKDKVVPEENKLQEKDGIQQEVKQDILQQGIPVVAIDKVRKNQRSGSTVEENKVGRDTVVIHTETKAKKVKSAISKRKAPKLKALLPTKEKMSLVPNEEKEPPQAPKGIEPIKNSTESKRQPLVKAQKEKAPAPRVSSVKSVKIVLEESIKDFAEEDDDKLSKSSKTSLKQKKKRKKTLKPEEQSSRAKVTTLRLNNRRMSIATRDSNAEDPLNTSFIRRASTFREWKKQARGVLPSQGGVEVDEERLDVISDLLNIQDAAKTLKLNPNETINSLKNEVHGRRSSATEELKQRFSSMQQQGKKRPLLLKPKLKVGIPDEENPEAVSNSETEENMTENDKRQLMLQIAVDDIRPAEKIAQIRKIAAHLARKRSLKKVIMEQAQVGGKERVLKKSEKIKSALAFYRMKLRASLHDMKNAADTLVWWKGDLKNIESSYGAETFIYFRWIRTIMFLNFMYLVTSFTFLVFPEMVKSGYADFHTSFSRLKVADLFTGSGSFTHKFSKFYYNGFSPTGGERYLSNTPFRFCLCLLIIFVINSIYIGYKTSYFYHSTRLESAIPGASVPSTVVELICSWELSINTPTAAKLRHQIIARDLRFMLAEIKHEEELKMECKLEKKKKTWEETLKDRFGIQHAHWIIFWAINIFSVICSLSNAVILYYLHEWRFVQSVHKHQEARNANLDMNYADVDPNFFIVIAPSVYTLISAQLYILCHLHLSRFEGWKSVENKLFSLLSRVGFFWVCEISVMYLTRHLNWETIKDNKMCWEITFGTEFYRLIVLQELVNFVFTLILDGYPARKHSRDENYQLPVFDVNRHTLNIIYIHTISGLAFVYCPMISFVVVVRLIITYYHERNVLQNWTRCNSSETNLRISQIYVPYLSAVFLSYITSSSLSVFLIFQLEASEYCGPFNHTHYSTGVKEALGGISLAAIHFLGHPGVSFTLMILLIAVLFMMKAWGHAFHLKMIQLHEFLVLEKKDRDFLLRALYNMGKSEEEKKEQDFDDDATSKWKDDLQNLVNDSTTARKKKTSLVDEDVGAKGLRRRSSKTHRLSVDAAESAFLNRSRRKSHAEALYLATAEHAMPHHAMHAHKAKEEFFDLKSQKSAHLHQMPSTSDPKKYFSSLHNIGKSVSEEGTAPNSTTERKSVYDDKAPASH